jgi:hypothetical protein
MATARVLSLGALCAYLIFPSSAFAYIDPGSSSLLLQLLFGGITGVLIIFKIYWKNLQAFLGRFSKHSASHRHMKVD